MPARRGFQVCFKHGAGTAKRVDDGARRRPGRPRIHGLYSDLGRASVRDEVRRLEEANVDLDDTDHEMLVAKGVNAYLLNVIEDVERARAARLADPREGARRGDDADIALQARLDALMHRVAANSLRIVRMAKTRAATKALLARDHALEIVSEYVKAVRHIIWDLLDDQALDVFEERLRDEVFRPLGVEVDLPARPAASADVVVPSSRDVD